MSRVVERPPDSPGEDNEAWREQWREYVEASYETGKGKKAQSWEEVIAEIPLEALRKNGGGNGDQERPPRDEEDVPESKVEDSSESSEVEGELPPLVQEGPRIMVCIGYELRVTRHGPKDYLYWRDEETGLVLPQYFQHYKKYPVGSKAVRTFIAALGVRPKRIDRISLRKLVGLRAKVFVQTVRPTYDSEALKGKPMPESLSYSKVSHLLKPLDRVDLTTLN